MERGKQNEADWREVGSVTDRNCLPPLTCAAGGTWLRCGWRGLRDGAPPMFLMSSMRCRHTGRSIFGALESSRLSWSSSLSAPPPPPFPVQLYLYWYPPYQQESIFVVTPLALSPSFPPGLVPVDLLNAVRAPFHVHPHHSYAILVVHLHPNPKRAFSGDQRSVGEPQTRARTTGPRLPCLLTTGPYWPVIKAYTLC